MKMAREIRGASLCDLEKETGIGSALLSQIEAGRVEQPGFQNVVKIARALSIKLDTLAEYSTAPARARTQFKTKQRGRPADFANIMERVLADVGKPMQRGKLVEAVEGRGVEIPADDKARYLGTILWRHKDRFVNIPNLGYWLRNEGKSKY